MKCDLACLAATDKTFWCERHKRRKTARLGTMCRENEELRQHLDDHTGETQQQPAKQSITQRQTKTVIIPKPKKAKKKRPILLGDMVSNALAMVGITEERVTKMIGRPCGCGRRKRKLNQLHLWAKRVLSGKTENAEEYLREMMNETP